MRLTPSLVLLPLLLAGCTSSADVLASGHTASPSASASTVGPGAFLARQACESWVNAPIGPSVRYDGTPAPAVQRAVALAEQAQHAATRWVPLATALHDAGRRPITRGEADSSSARIESECARFQIPVMVQ